MRRLPQREQDDATRLGLDAFGDVTAISHGCAEVMIGRGSFVESCPLFGYDLNQCEELFNEKLDLFAQLLAEERVTWRGRTRAPLVELYHRALAELGKPVLRVGLHAPGDVADTDAQARDELYAPYKAMRDRIGTERGWDRAMTRADFDREAESGSLYVGSPETVAQRIAATAKLLGLARFNLKYSAGALSHEKLMRCIELYGSRVIPRVRELLRHAPSA